MKKTFRVSMIEIGMVLGIVSAAFIVPRSTPLITFGIISGVVLVLGNVLLITNIRRVSSEEARGLSREQNRRLNLIIIVFTVYWLLCFLLRKG
ncbi:MAG TPA: hypothetical protein VJ453_01915 [Terriglobales bacterium]|nr:hypothetical protein [Terriglobales bacterium]